MHMMAERPIEVRRIIFSKGPTHNTRSASRVAENSSTELADSAQPNYSLHPLYKYVFVCLLITKQILDVYAHYRGVSNTGVYWPYSHYPLDSLVVGSFYK